MKDKNEIIKIGEDLIKSVYDIKSNLTEYEAIEFALLIIYKIRNAIPRYVYVNNLNPVWEMWEEVRSYIETKKLKLKNSYSKFSDLKVGDIIELENKERFKITKIFKQYQYVDMISTKQYNPEVGMNWYEEFFSVKLEKFKIISHE